MKIRDPMIRGNVVSMIFWFLDQKKIISTDHVILRFAISMIPDEKNHDPWLWSWYSCGQWFWSWQKSWSWIFWSYFFMIRDYDPSIIRDLHYFGSYEMNLKLWKYSVYILSFRRNLYCILLFSFWVLQLDYRVLKNV